ncbi:DMT family transporter [Neptunicoccus sediminis]|uniref:DMT family transporter n=1 Tax=Neptunicoccus sediminis TaxID=1892596 RepID=UPI0008461333|nr:DMT family transporter [Neptunicoccus sediminis]
MTPSPQNPGLVNWLSIIALGAIWGGAFLATKLALDGFGPWWVAAGRVGIAALAITVLGGMMGQGLHQIKGVRSWLFVCAFGLTSVATGMALLAFGQQHVPSAFAGISMGAVPLLILPLAAVFSKEEHIGPRQIAGFLVGFIGLAVLLGPDALSSSGRDLEQWGQIACIGTAASYAVGSIIMRRSPHMPQLALAAATLWVGTVVLVPIALVIEGPPASLDRPAGYALLYAALIPTAVGAILRVRIITSAGSVFMSLSSYMVPVWSVVLGALLLGEDLTRSMLWGMGLVLGGIAISQSRALMSLLRK